MDEPTKGLWARIELRANLALLAVSVVLLAVGLLLRYSVLVGAGMLATAFFAVYSIYAYVRRPR